MCFKFFLNFSNSSLDSSLRVSPGRPPPPQVVIRAERSSQLSRADRDSSNTRDVGLAIGRLSSRDCDRERLDRTVRYHAFSPPAGVLVARIGRIDSPSHLRGAATPTHLLMAQAASSVFLFVPSSSLPLPSPFPFHPVSNHEMTPIDL